MRLTAIQQCIDQYIPMNACMYEIYVLERFNIEM